MIFTSIGDKLRDESLLNTHIKVELELEKSFNLI